MKSLTITTFLFIALSSIKAHSNVQIGNFQCPTEFEGTVTNVAQVDKKDHSLAKVKITFKNDYAVRGAGFNEKTVEILKHGMIQVEPGALYSVALRGNKVYDIREI